MSEELEKHGVDVYAAMTIYVDANSEDEAAAIVAERYLGTAKSPWGWDMLDGADIPMKGEDFLSSAVTFYGACGSQSVVASGTFSAMRDALKAAIAWVEMTGIADSDPSEYLAMKSAVSLADGEN